MWWIGALGELPFEAPRLSRAAVLDDQDDLFVIESQ